MTPENRDTVTNSLAPERFVRVRALFETAMARPAQERRAYLEGACGLDRALLEQVQGMLAAEVKNGLLDGSPSSASAPEEGRFPAGTVLAGRYRVLGMLGRGGMGEVYKAFDLILNQVVALKFLNPAHVSEAALARFRNEVRIARQVSHPNVCRVYDLGMVEGLHFLSMEYIDGEDLASLLRRIGRLPQDKAIEFTRKICAGLGAAHERGVLHRDLKPANVMIDGRGQPRITDFGLAGLAAEIPLSDLRSGTPAYMSPEQKAGREVTTRSDIYSLGLVLYEMFTGKQRKDTQSSPSEIVKDLDPAIERVILRCLEEEPRRRPSTALSVAMGLPGGDPIAAALAAGETPSPEMIAASQEKEGFSARTAVVLFLGVLLVLGAGIAIHTKISLLSRAPLPYPPDAMAEKVRQILHEAGYAGGPTSAEYGYVCCDLDTNRYITGLARAGQDRALLSHRPALIYFYYQQDQTDPEWLRGPILPTHTPVASQIRVFTDAQGRLVRLEVDPTSGAGTPVEFKDWDTFFRLAGLDLSRFTQGKHDTGQRLPANQYFAWDGDYGNGLPERVHVEGGIRDGHVVLFSVDSGPREQLKTTGWMNVLVILIPGLFIVLVWLAARNLGQGRTDPRGSRVIASAALLLGLGQLFLWPSYLTDGAIDFGTFFLVALAIWLCYVAAEPYVRRYWPDALISWSRFCSGKIRDPLVASHILIGVLVGEAWGVLVWPSISEFVKYGGVAGIAGNGLLTINGPGALVGDWMLRTQQGLAFGMLLMVMVVLLRLAVRKLWLADLLAGTVVVLILAGANAPFLTYFGMGVPWLSFMWFVRRFGVLSFLALWMSHGPAIYHSPVFTGWLVSRTVPIHIVPVAIAAWATWVVVSKAGPREGTNESRA